MFFFLSKALDFFSTPLCWILILFILALVLKNKQHKRLCLYATLFLLLFFSNPFFANKVMRWWETPAYPSASIKEPYDVGIVMGGSMRYYDQEAGRVVYSSSVDRMLQALQLYHEGKIKKILLTGGSGFVNFQDWKESGLIAKVLLNSGVRESDLILESQSRNTYENALFTAKMLRELKVESNILLITSAFHMRRSQACFVKQGIETQAFSVDVRSGVGMYTPDKIFQPDAENLALWDALFHEWIGYAMYRLMGYC